MSVSPDDNCLQTAEKLRETAYAAGVRGDIVTMRIWGALLVKGLEGCGGKCGCDKSTCRHCQPLGAGGATAVEVILDRVSATNTIQPPDWILALNKGETNVE